MSQIAPSYATWLADFYLLSAVFLAVALVAIGLLRQPAHRLAVVKSTLIGLSLLAALCALPGWSVVHLLTEERPQVVVEPVLALQPPATTDEVRAQSAAIRAPMAGRMPEPSHPLEAVRPSASPSLQVDWSTVLPVAHFVGAVCISVWLLLGLVASMRLRKSAKPAPPEIVATLNEFVAAQRTSVNRLQLLTHDRIDVPVALGIWRPTILLPASWCDEVPLPIREGLGEGSSGIDLRAVLAHESTHVFNHDLQWLAIMRLLFVALWGNPLFWFARRRLRLDQEALADAAAAEVTSRQQFAEQLVAWARNVRSGPAMQLSAAVGLWEGPSQLRQRIGILLNERFTVLRNCSRGWRIAVGVLAIAAAMSLSTVTLQPTSRADEKSPPEQGALAAAAPVTPADKTETRSNPTPSRLIPNVVNGRVLDDKDQPVAGAEVFLFRINQREGTRKLVAKKLTEADGRYRFENVIDIAKEFPDRKLPGPYEMDNEMLEGFVCAAGRITNSWPVLPEEVAKIGNYNEIIMLPAATLRGRVTDANGKPVAGALVSIGSGSITRWEGAQASRTDADGNYKIDDAAPFDEAEFKKQVADLERQRKENKARGTGTFQLWRSPPILAVEHPDHAVKLTTFERSPGSKDVQLEPAAVLEGRVVFADSGKPAAGAMVGVIPSVQTHGPPLTHPLGNLQMPYVETDAEGKYRVGSLPAGNYELWADTPEWVNVGVNDVAAVANKTSVVPDLKFTKGGVVSARIVDVKSRQPITIAPQTRVVMFVQPVLPRPSYRPLPAPFINANSEGRFELRLTPGKKMIDASGLEVSGDVKFSPPPTTEVNVVDGETITVDLPVTELETPEQPGGSAQQTPVTTPTSSAAAPPAKQPAATEFAGRVDGPDGKPLAGVTVDAWTWYRGNETTTDDRGQFRLKGFSPNEEVEIEFRKKGYGPRLFVNERAGTPDWVVKMDSSTYLEGQLTDREGKPVANTVIRADRGPFKNPQVSIAEVTTQTRTDKDGNYRLYLEPDTYLIKIRAPGRGVARYDALVVSQGEQKKFDIRLQEGVTFKAKVLDSMTDKPVEGTVLWNWTNRGIEGASNADGVLEVPAMFPGKFEFNVSAVGANRTRDSIAGKYARWWSQEALKEHQRKLDKDRHGFQRNFDDLEFNVANDAAQVTIYVEPCVTITGRVLDPDGKPVAGATVAPAKTGSGNSLTGDTRFSYVTKSDGTFEMKMPASGLAQYNLIAHDGKYRQFRNWANGAGQPFSTLPGDRIDKVELKLTRPATIRGQVLSETGEPVVGKDVRAADVKKRDNRYYVPTTKTDREGKFELKFVSPGKHYIQVEPFWLDADQAPEGTSIMAEVKEGETIEGVLIAPQFVRSENKPKKP